MNNNIFKISRDLDEDNIATYNNIPLRALNRFDLGSSISFHWGDSSPGSEALAYAILEKVGSKEIASSYAKVYTENIISKIKQDTWTLNGTAVIQWINENTNYSIDESAFFKSGTTKYEYENRRHEDRRKEERRLSTEKDSQEKAQKSLQEIQAKYQQELDNYKKQIIKQNTDIEEYQAQLKKYKLFIESLDIKSMYNKYCDIDN